MIQGKWRSLLIVVLCVKVQPAVKNRKQTHAQKNLQRWASRRIRSRCPKPPKLAPLCSVMEQRLRALLFMSKAESSHASEETHFSCLYPWSDSFGHHSKLMTVGEGWIVARLVYQRLCPLAQLPLQQQPGPADACRSHAPFYPHTPR